MAFRAVATARPPPALSCAPKPSPPLSTKPTGPAQLPRQQFKKTTPLSSAASPTALSLLFLLSTPNDAKAFSFSKEQILTSLTDVENVINQAIGVGSSIFEFSKGIIQTTVDVLRPGIDVGLPIVQKAGSKVVEIASPVVSGAISGAANKAQESLESAGFDAQPVLSAAKTIIGAAPKVIESAKPVASTTVETLLSSDPRTIVVAGGALFLSYLLLPPIWLVISLNLRGYKGDLSAAQSLDLISSKNFLMIDIRSEKDKNKMGIPQLPSSAKNKMISIPLEELPTKLRSLVSNAKKVEAEMVALKISYLKRINKGSNLVIMDSYADTAKIVARALTSLGFKNCWIMAYGFSGGRGWIQSRLGTESYKTSLVEIVSPSRIIPAAAGRLGTTSFQSTRKLLPGSADD